MILYLSICAPVLVGGLFTQYFTCVSDEGFGIMQDRSFWGTLSLAFQTLGVVYGDMGTSPLYVFTDVFSKVPITSEIDILGALSIVVYTIALVPLAKYVFIVLKANDNGEGMQFSNFHVIMVNH